MDKVIVLDTALTAGAAGAFLRAKSYEEQAKNKIQNLDRLESITILYLGQNKKFKEEPKMKFKKIKISAVSKLSNKTKVAFGVGFGLLGATIIKDRVFDHRDCDACGDEPAITFDDVTEAAEDAASEIAAE